MCRQVSRWLATSVQRACRIHHPIRTPATLVDVIGSGALLTLSERGGVSLNINTNYLNALPMGRTALIMARVIKLGGRIATVSASPDSVFAQYGQFEGRTDGS